MIKRVRIRSRVQRAKVQSRKMCKSATKRAHRKTFYVQKLLRHEIPSKKFYLLSLIKFCAIVEYKWNEFLFISLQCKTVTWKHVNRNSNNNSSNRKIVGPNRFGEVLQPIGRYKQNHNLQSEPRSNPYRWARYMTG